VPSGLRDEAVVRREIDHIPKYSIYLLISVNQTRFKDDDEIIVNGVKQF